MTQQPDPIVQFSKTVARCFAELSKAAEQFANECPGMLPTLSLAAKRPDPEWKTAVADIRKTIQGLEKSLAIAPSAATSSEPDNTWTEADTAWGYKFGRDGLKKNCDAAAFLGVSSPTIYRLISDNKLRQGTGGQICFRSLTEYAHSLER